MILPLFAFNMARLVLLLAILAATRVVTGHGFLKNVQVNGKTYPAWQVGQDDFVKPPPVRYVRKLKDNGSAPDFTSKDITYDLSANRWYALRRINTDII